MNRHLEQRSNEKTALDEIAFILARLNPGEQARVAERCRIVFGTFGPEAVVPMLREPLGVEAEIKESELPY